MAQGWLWQGVGTAEKEIAAGAAKYEQKFGRRPAAVRVKLSRITATTPGVIDGVQVLIDETVQPCCYLFMAGKGEK